MHPTINRVAKHKKAWCTFCVQLRGSLGWKPRHLHKNASHGSVCIAIWRWRCPLRPPHHVLSRCVFISNKFPRLLAEREIIANAFISPDFSPNRGQSYKIFGNKNAFEWKICEILAKEWKTKRCQVPSLDIFFHRKYLQSVSRFATPSFVKKLKIIAVVCGKVFESRRNCVSLWTKG